MRLGKGKDYIYALRLQNCRVGDLFIVKAKTKEGALKIINKEMDPGDIPYKSSWFETLGKFPSFEAFKRSEIFLHQVKPDLQARRGIDWETSSVRGLSKELGSGSGISLFGY